MRVGPAGGEEDPWGDGELEALLEDARRWQRIRATGILDPEVFLRELVSGFWGARMDGAGGRLEVAPFVPSGWRGMSLRRLRAHRTLLDLEVRPRAEWVTVRIAVVFGPAMALALRVRNTSPIASVTVDEIPVGGPRAVFTAGEEHEVVFFLACRV